MSVARRDFAGAAAATTLGGDINSTDTSITIASASGWPTGSNGEFYICIDRGHAGEEKALVLSRSGTTLTLASSAKRGVDGTSAASHSAGVTVEHVLAAADLDEANAHIADTTRDDHTQYLTAARLASTIAAYPKGVVYRSANITANQSGISGSADVTGMTAIAVTGDGVRRIRITVHLANLVVSSGDKTVYLYEGATEIARLSGSQTLQSTQEGSYNFIPASGSHTYKIKVFMTGSIFNTATQPSWVLAEDIGNV